MQSDLSRSGPMDPARPWLVDPEQDPRAQNWLPTLFDPTGHSPKLHFTRAWTLLFMLQLVSVFGFGLILFVVGLAGANTDGLSVFATYVAAGVFLVTSLMSLVIHTRRLNHADRNPVLALLVVLPLAVALAVTIVSVNRSAATYDEMYQARSDFLDDPRGYREAELERLRVENQQAVEEPEPNSWGAPGNQGEEYNAEDVLPTQEAFILRPHVARFYFIIMGLSGLLVPWSLMWLARAERRS